MSEIYQVSPWYDTEEWNRVYNDIFGVTSTLTTKKNALDQLFIWKARCPSLPSGIEATISLLNIHIQDQGRHYDICNDHVLRLAYSSALMRFVNVMFDKETKKGLSLFQAADTFGIPEWIIDLRHNTAHSNIVPHIELLREASVISLDWLQKNYWDKHKSCISDYIVGSVHIETEIEKKITSLMNFCVSLSICSHPKCNIKNLAEITDIHLRESLVNDAKEVCEDLDFSNLKIISIDTLGNILNIQAKKILIDEASSSYVNRALLSNESAFISIEILKSLDYIGYTTDKPLNTEYVQCFTGLLSFLFTYDLLKDFVLELIKVTQSEHENSVKCKLAAKWVSVILKALKNNQQFMEKIYKADTDIMSKDEKELKSLYYHWYPNYKKRTLFLDLHKSIPREFTNINFIQPIISTYNPYLVLFIRDLLTLVRPQLSDSVKTKICKLAKVIASPEKFPVMSPKIYTSDDLDPANNLDSINESKHYEDVKIMEVQMESKNKVDKDGSKQKFGVWQLASKNASWATCPIGQLPWTQLTNEPMESQ
ncbi:uncharacterized protein LOC123874558 isoform X1 [Maniola jurtina]|uniref:uncharacterized protein LOC123874558 isoform X1 n=1 Tax=Maniola jurtina TaxID=191418 RepID=UPI001E68A39E|nr:uncharacterized protein LOC123874558 isoform X1 [Maniola jurtina]